MGAVLIVVIAAIIILGGSKPTGYATQQIETVPLSPQERQVVANAVLSSEFISDLPKKHPVAIFFYSFENGQRIWRDGFLVGPTGFLSEGEPEVYITIHSKYIPELESGSLCDVMGRAYKAGDVGFESQKSKASLLLKYAGMMKHKSCLGL